MPTNVLKIFFQENVSGDKDAGDRVEPGGHVHRVPGVRASGRATVEVHKQRVVADHHFGPSHEESILQAPGVAKLRQTLDGTADIVRQDQTHQQTGQRGTGEKTKMVGTQSNIVSHKLINQ